MRRIATKEKVVLGAHDSRLTPRAGLHLVAKLDELLSISGTIAAFGSSFKKRDRGLTLGQLMVSLSETMLAGGDFLCDLDFQRADAAGLELRAVPDVPASVTVIGLGKRFDTATRAQVEDANAVPVKRAFSLLPDKRRAELLAERPTIDLGPTDIEVYGRNKRGSAFNYQGQRVYLSHPAIWAESGWALAAELGSGRTDPAHRQRTSWHGV